MTEVATEAVAEEGWDASEQDSAVTYPEYPDKPHNHNFTISFDGRGPMVAIRAQSAVEFNSRLQELEDAGTLTLVASVYSHMKAEMAVANGVGPVSPAPAPQGPPVPPTMPQQYNQQPAQQFPGAPGTAPAAWQNAGAPAAPAAPQVSPEYQQAGWYRLNVPFKQKGQFDGITAQYGMQKGRPSEGGQFSFQKADKSWYVHPQYAGAFPMFNPVPA